MSDTPQAQAEDRRAEIQARLENVKGALRDNELDILNKAHRASWDDIEWLLAELSRLSRVEQALRELVASWRDLARYEDREAGNALKANNVGPANLSYHTACARRRGFTFCADGLEAALSASPSSQPKER